MAGFTLVSRFPGNYMKMNLYGSGSAGIFSSGLQIISLSVGESTASSALIYFICGTLALVATCILVYFSFSSPRFVFYLGDTVADQQRNVHTFAEMKQVARKIWPCMIVFYSFMLTMGMGHPNITSSIVSENYGNGNAWNGNVNLLLLASSYFS